MVALRIREEFIPLGNVDGFLTEIQLREKYADKNETSVKTNMVDECVINFVLEPAKTRFDPIGEVVQNSWVEENLDTMFKYEDIGVEREISDFDNQKISDFQSKMTFNRSNYEVELPWNENISEVRSNHEISKAVLYRVVKNLKDRNLYDSYNDVLKQQLDDQILEKIPLDQVNLEDH